MMNTPANSTFSYIKCDLRGCSLHEMVNVMKPYFMNANFGSEMGISMNTSSIASLPRPAFLVMRADWLDIPGIQATTWLTS